MRHGWQIFKGDGMARKKKGAGEFKAKSRGRGDAPKPRLLLVTEGEMEDGGLPDFVKKVVESEGLKFQVLSRTKRIHNGDSVPATKIARDLERIFNAVIDVESEYLACVVDLEGRGCTREQFECDIVSRFSNDKVAIGVACRSIENWLLADTRSMERVVKPCVPVNHDKFSNPDNIPHPAERELKKHWSRYKKSQDGVKFLKKISPEVVRGRSGSFEKFCGKLSLMGRDLED
jgi:hypothetical protein